MTNARAPSEAPYREDATALRRALPSGEGGPPLCPECRLALALGFGADVTCPVCGTRVALLEEDLARRDASPSHRNAAAAAAAAPLIRRRPGRAALAFDRLEALLLLGPLGLFVASAVGWVLVAMHATDVARKVGWHPIDVLGGGAWAAAVAGLSLGGCLFAVAVAVVVSDRLDAVARAQAACAALEPAAKGAAPRCRACEAPLDVEAGDGWARCLYCGEDSMVGLPSRWLARGRKRAKRKGELPEGAPSRGKVARLIAGWLAFALALGGVFGACGACGSSQRGGRWGREVAGARVVHGPEADHLLPEGAQVPLPADCEPPERGRWHPACNYQVALRRGERSTITFDHVSAALQLTYAELDDGEWTFSPAWHTPIERATEGAVVAHRVATFTAPYDGWFVFHLLHAQPDVLGAGTPTMAWSISTDEPPAPQPPATRTIELADLDEARLLGFSRDGAALLVAGGSRVLAYDARTGAVLHAVQGVRGATLSSDGDALYVALEGGIDVLDPVGGTTLGHVATPLAGLTAASPERMLFVRERGGAQIVDARTMASRDLPAHASGAFSRDGALVAYVAGGRLSVRDVATWDERAAIDAPSDVLAFTADGRTIAVARGESIGMWSIGASAPPRTLSGHAGTVAALAFSPDGRWLASAALDGTLLLWDLSPDGARATEVPTWFGTDWRAVAFSPDGHTVAAMDGLTIDLFSR